MGQIWKKEKYKCYWITNIPIYYTFRELLIHYKYRLNPRKKYRNLGYVLVHKSKPKTVK